MKGDDIASAAKEMRTAASLIERYGDDQKALGAEAARKLASVFAPVKSLSDIPEAERPAVRNGLNLVLSELKTASEAKGISKEDRETAKSTHDLTMRSVQYAPWWVRILSTLCLGLGTMIGYRRIVTTLGERLGKQKLVPAQGGSAELAAAAVIGAAGFSGFPVSTTHVVTGGISGTMMGSGAGLQPATAWQIATAWILTLPATILLSDGLFYLLS
jgi:inorganic phosphate transporter, PiT family